ncbi:MAG TPA: vitamin B12-dependent ribonucleotide reductase [Longimicrobiales bacterium]|nr:vitamin B12-dependent ribonucleotide reductase [Longimicrobiales bacterium]
MTPKPAPRPNPADVLPDDLPVADMSENARIILAKRYLKKDEAGKAVEGSEQMFWRVARTVAEVDAKYGASEGGVDALAREFYRLMTQRLFEPNSPTLMNAGRPLGQLSACFVLPVEDALSNGKNGIYDTLRSMALVHQSGGGTGFAFSRLRPSSDVVKSTMGVASGPVSFMKLYDASTEVVKQGGTRRGANMGILRVDHPDIREFIACKNDVTQVTNFNISVAITDAFMEAVRAGESYDLISPRSGEVVGSEDANEIFDLIIRGAWATGEPGVFFIDRANHYNPVPKLGSYEATNPCGEQPLLAYDVCNLGSVNVGMFAKTGMPEGTPAEDRIDWEAFRQAVHLSTHFLDNVIDANNYPLPEITELARQIRRIGLGIMGWADLLVRVGVPYDSDEAISLARTVMHFVDDEAKNASERLADVRGAFPAWKESIWGPDKTAARDAEGNRIRPMRKLRNCNVTTVAPTGTISIFADCSGGIEPLFAVAFMRNQAGSLMADVNGDFVRLAQEQGWYSEALMESIAEQGHIHFDEVPDDVQRLFVTAHDVTPQWHIRMQAAFQEHVDSAISKTCNFPHEATREDVREIYLQAFALGCKGVTVYRDGCRPMQVLSTGKTAKQEAGAGAPSSLSPAASASPEDAGRSAGKSAGKTADLEAALADAREENHRLIHQLEEVKGALLEMEIKHQRRLHKKTRPDVLTGTTRKMRSPLGDLYVTVNEDEAGRPFEVFMTLGKAGGAAMADAEALGRMISLALRSGIPLGDIAKQIRGISCDRAVGYGPTKVLSMPDAVGQVLELHMAEKEGIQQELPIAGTPGMEAAAIRTPRSTGGRGIGAGSGPGATQPQVEAYDPGDAFMGTCPECASDLQFAEGCVKCLTCGYSECG